MPPRRRVAYTVETIEQQLQQIHLLDPSSATENLEQLGPIIAQVYTSRQQDALLKTLRTLIDEKDAEVEKICGDNYTDYVSSVTTLFTIRSYSQNLREKITSTDASVAQVGRGLVDQKRALLKSKRTANNLDEAIDNLQACLGVLDVVNRVQGMVKEGKYWSALRSLEDIQSLPPTSLIQTPFFQHLLSSLPSIRTQIKDAVTASMKQWLLDIRNVSALVGRFALEAMEARTRRWRNRREKDPALKLSRVGSAVELVSHEKSEFNILDNEKLKVEFKPLYESIHIYATLDSLETLQTSYQEDRKAQLALILPNPIPLASLPKLTQEITGFFIIEQHVLRSTPEGFRVEREVEELWEEAVSRVTEGVEEALRNETDAELFLKVKETLIGFIMTLEAHSHSTTRLHAFTLLLFEKYAYLLEQEFSRHFDEIVLQDDHQSMMAENAADRDKVLATVWISEEDQQRLKSDTFPVFFPWSQSFYESCEDIRSFVQKFYQFVEGVSQHHRDIDELLGKSLDNLLKDHVAKNVDKRLQGTSISQIAQVVTNVEHFDTCCSELERSLTDLRSTQRGGIVRITEASKAFRSTLSRATARIHSLIAEKLDAFFELSEYDWTPNTRESESSMYLYELVNWLTTVVDSLQIRERYRDDAYKRALTFVSDWFMKFLTGRDVSSLNENAVANLLVDVKFLDDQFKDMGRSELMGVFSELKLMISLVMESHVPDYLNATTRQARYQSVKPKRLAAVLEKLARFGASSRLPAEREKGERRRHEAEAVGRILSV